jgi:valyl-tRNA synthetase
MFARFRRAIGYNVLFPLGLDRNGLPIEIAAEKKFGIDISSTSREEFINYCRKLLEEYSLNSIEIFKKCGISFNSYEPGEEIGDMYLTDSESYRALTQRTFIELWKKGLIYEAEYPTNYCPGCKTTLADAEIDYEEFETNFVDVKFKVKETGEEIIISTTRPELLAACAMVIFNPADERYRHLDGKTAITPIYEKEVKIAAHPMADPQKGTGLVMMCSYGDTADIRFFREQNLTPIFLIDSNGKMNANSGFLSGLSVTEARKKAIEELKHRGLVVGERKILHRTPICSRSKHPIEFISMKEFYLKQIEFKQKMLEMAKELHFYSEESRQRLIDWINSISIDWPISKRRYYATEVPLWYCKKCGKTILPKPGKYYIPWKEKIKCKCGGEAVGEERVFDTWFDSSISPLYILGYKRKEFYKKNKVCSLRPQGNDIVRTWLYYTLLKCYLLTKRRIFKDVWINYMIVDEKGRKMSKSLGNVIDPNEIIDRYGAEPLRLWAAFEGDITKQDFRCSFDRIESAQKTLIKLWNIAKFASQFIEDFEKIKEKIKDENLPTTINELSDIDKLIIKEINALIKYARSRYLKYDFHNPSIRIRHIMWEIIASHYLEMIKCRIYDKNHEKFSEKERNSAIITLFYTLKILLKLLAPIIPFITYKIYKEIFKGNIHLEEFPKSLKIEMKKTAFTLKQLMELNSRIWKYKKEKNLPLNAEIDEFKISKRMQSAEKDIKLTHKIKNIIWK